MTTETNRLLESIKIREKKRRKNTLLAVIILSTLAVLTLFINIRSHNEYEKNNAFLQNKKDLLLSIDSIREDERLKDTLKSIVLQFYDRRGKHDSSMIDLFADTLERFYLLQNASRETVLKEEKRYWKKHQDEIPPQISSIATSSELRSSRNFVFVKERYCKSLKRCSDLITVIKFNDLKEIIYVRSYYDLESNSQRRIFGEDTIPSNIN